MYRNIVRLSFLVLCCFTICNFALALQPFQNDWTAYGLGKVPDIFLNSLSVSFTVPSDAGSSNATFSLLFGVADTSGTFLGTRLFYNGTQPNTHWTVSSESYGPYFNGRFPEIAIQPGDKLQADYFRNGVYGFSVRLTNLNTGVSNTNTAGTIVGFTQLYFAWDNPWSSCSNYPRDGLEVFNGFTATCFDGINTPQCANGVTWTTGINKPACNLAAHVDQYPQQVSLTWSTAIAN